MTSSVALTGIFVLTHLSVTIDSTALRSHRTRQRNDNAKKLDPIVAPLYIAQYDRFDGTAPSVPDFYYQLPLGVGTPGTRVDEGNFRQRTKGFSA